jgi:hypothetical protein
MLKLKEGGLRTNKYKIDNSILYFIIIKVYLLFSNKSIFIF